MKKNNINCTLRELVFDNKKFSDETQFKIGAKISFFFGGNRTDLLNEHISIDDDFKQNQNSTNVDYINILDRNVFEIYRSINEDCYIVIVDGKEKGDYWTINEYRKDVELKKLHVPNKNDLTAVAIYDKKVKEICKKYDPKPIHLTENIDCLMNFGTAIVASAAKEYCHFYEMVKYGNPLREGSASDKSRCDYLEKVFDNHLGIFLPNGDGKGFTSMLRREVRRNNKNKFR